MIFKNRKEIKMLKKQLIQNEQYKQTIFQAYTSEKADKENFISYDVFTNQFLIINNILKNGQLWEELINERDDFFQEKNQIAFRDFIISWTINPRFSSTLLVPIISYSIDSNTKILSWNTSDNDEINKLLKLYNDFLEKYLVDEGFSVEVIPNVIVKYNHDLKVYNLYFDPVVLEYSNKMKETC